MPLSKEAIFGKIVSKIETAASHLEAFGCASGAPRVQDYLSEAAGLYLDGLTSEERTEFGKLLPSIGWISSERRIQCGEIPIIKKEAEKFRRWSREEFLK